MHVVDVWTMVLDFDDPLGTWIGHSLLRVCRASRAAVQRALSEGRAVWPPPEPRQRQTLSSAEVLALLVQVDVREDDWHLAVELVEMTSARDDEMLIALGERVPALFHSWRFWDNVSAEALANRPALLEWLCSRDGVLDKRVLLSAAAVTRDSVTLWPVAAALLRDNAVAAWLLLYATERGRGNAGRVCFLAASYACAFRHGYYSTWEFQFLRPANAVLFRSLSCAETREVAELVLGVFLPGHDLRRLNFTRDVRPHLAATSTPAVVDWLRDACR